MEACIDCTNVEFRPENVAPTHEDSSLFVKPQWKWKMLHYFIYRVLAATLMIAWLTFDFFEEAGKFYSDNYAIWFIFATNWSFIILALNTIFLAVASGIHYRNLSRNGVVETTEPRKLTWPLMIMWVIYNIATNGALVVTISYWLFLLSMDSSHILINAMSRIKHSLNTIYVLTDIMVNAIPIRVFHLIYPMALGAIYVVFNAEYFINEGPGPEGKPYAYDMMDWRHPIKSALICSLGFIMTTIVQGLLYGIYRLRLFIYHKVYDIYEETPSSEKEETDGIISSSPNNPTYSAVDTIEMDTYQSDTP